MAAALAFLAFAVFFFLSIFFTSKEIGEMDYVDNSCLADMRKYSAESGNLFKYRIEKSSNGAYRWALDVGPSSREFWFVHEPTTPGVFAELAGRRVIHVDAGKVTSFISSEFDEDEGRSHKPFEFLYSYAHASKVNPAMLKYGVRVGFPVVGESRVMQTARDGAMRDYVGFKDWPESHGASEALQAVDIMAPQGTEIVSASAGIVVEVSQENRDLGCRSTYVALANRVIVLGDDGFQYEYAHVQKMSSFVKAGDRVRIGDRLALVGNSGSSPAPHLHFAVQTMLPHGPVVSVPVDFLPCGKGYRGGSARNGVVSCNP